MSAYVKIENVEVRKDVARRPKGSGQQQGSCYLVAIDETGGEYRHQGAFPLRNGCQSAHRAAKLAMDAGKIDLDSWVADYSWAEYPEPTVETGIALPLPEDHQSIAIKKTGVTIVYEGTKELQGVRVWATGDDGRRYASKQEFDLHGPTAGAFATDAHAKPRRVARDLERKGFISDPANWFEVR